ncbi:Hypothetical predicted protein [Octopus vulgaris]|uniref:Uncharacterized protein n=1 Tax=Octopus vulgaris TaxID=6645 RepID=A0AA36F677_OCTVU|nr:Hypothetical predicted protein [Octopus vulgaris]
MESFTPNTDILASECITSIKAMILKHQMRWCVYIVRMMDERTPKQLFYVELAAGKRYRCKAKNSFKDSVKSTIKSLGMDPEDIRIAASDQTEVRTKVWKGVKAFEEARITHARLRRVLKKNVMTEEETRPYPKLHASRL